MPGGLRPVLAVPAGLGQPLRTASRRTRGDGRRGRTRRRPGGLYAGPVEPLSRRDRRARSSVRCTSGGRGADAVRVIAVDLRDDALELARGAGADIAVSAVGLTPEQLRAEVGARGAGVILDCVASDGTLELAAGSVAVGGDICYVGRGGGSLAVSPGRLPFECSVSLPSWGSLPELGEVVALARSGAIHVEVERVALEETVEAYRRLRRGDVRGRLVAVLST
jgi:Zn-dependent alcohol dehydrogenase